MDKVKESNMAERPAPETVYRSGDSLVLALVEQLQIPAQFFDVHYSLKRSIERLDIQDPNTWVAEVVPKENAKKLQADIRLNLSGSHFNFSTNGTFPDDLKETSDAGIYAQLIIGEAKLRLIQKLMPDTYASGKHKVEKAITAIVANRKKLIVNLGNPKITSLTTLLNHKESLRLSRAVVIAPVIASLVLNSCTPIAVAKDFLRPFGGTPLPTPYVITNEKELSAIRGEVDRLKNDPAEYQKILDSFPTNQPEVIIERTQLPSVPEPRKLTEKEKITQSYLEDTIVAKDIYKPINPEIQALLVHVKEKYGITIVNPIFSKDGTQRNLGWNDREIKIIVEQLSRLPPNFQEEYKNTYPKSILLYKIRGTDFPGATAGYNSNFGIEITIAETFDLFAIPIIYGEIFGIEEGWLRSAITHEWTHIFHEKNPDAANEWSELAGWYMDENGNWQNSDRNALPQFLPEHAGLNPAEDLSISMQLFEFNPHLLNANRQVFIIKYFYKWPPVQKYLKDQKKP